MMMMKLKYKMLKSFVQGTLVFLVNGNAWIVCPRCVLFIFEAPLFLSLQQMLFSILLAYTLLHCILLHFNELLPVIHCVTLYSHIISPLHIHFRCGPHPHIPDWRAPDVVSADSAHSGGTTGARQPGLLPVARARQRGHYQSAGDPLLPAGRVSQVRYGVPGRGYQDCLLRGRPSVCSRGMSSEWRGPGWCS